MADPSQLAKEIAKTVRDFDHYFDTLDNPKLEEWIEDTLQKKDPLRRWVARLQDFLNDGDDAPA